MQALSAWISGDVFFFFFFFNFHTHPAETDAATSHPFLVMCPECKGSESFLGSLALPSDLGKIWVPIIL